VLVKHDWQPPDGYFEGILAALALAAAFFIALSSLLTAMGVI